MRSAARRPSFGDLRLVCDYLRGVRNEIALDIHTIGMAGKDPRRYGKIPRPGRWLGKVKYLPFLSKVVHRVSLPVWHFVAPVLFKRQLRAVQGQRTTAPPAQFDAGGQLIAFSLRTLDIVHARHIDPVPRQWLEFPWLPLGKRPEGVRTLAAASLLDDADLRRSLALARLAHRVLPRRRGMSGWGLQSYTAWRWFFARLAVDKLPGPLLMIEHFDRSAVLVDGSIQRSRQRQPARRLTLMQHGSVNADVTPRGLGVSLPTRLRAVSHLHVYSAADAQVFKEEILSPKLVERGFGVSFYRPSIALTDMCAPGIPSILFVGYPLCEAAHRALMRALRDTGQWQLFYKPHPTNRASAGIAQLPWVMVEGRSVFPRVDLIVSYPSTLVSEYAAHGIPAVVHRMDVPPDQIVARMSEIVQITRERRAPAATNICGTAMEAAPSPTPPPMTQAPSRPYRICSRCIMDTSDPDIRFDAQGLCEYCNNFDTTIKPHWHTGAEGERQLARLADTIRKAGRGRDFDCIIGLSGGLDSSYSAYVAKEKMGLRPLLFHVDAGWNTDQAVGNIEKLVDGLGLDLYTEVINWEEMKDLQVAFLKSGIPDQDLPQDAAFFSSLYKFARQYGIKHVITGSNFSTECCREPEEWGGYLGIDTLLFHDIHRRFGKRPLETFPLKDILVYKLYYQQILGMKVHHPLNLVPFIKKDAEDELGRRFGWQRFQHKHHESRFTRFYEDYWLPRKFGFHKRRAHFSSLIMTGQMTREAALARIARPEMDEHFLKQEFEYVAHKLDLTVDELQQIFDGPNKTYRDYRNKRWMIGLGANAMRWLGLEKRYFR